MRLLGQSSDGFRCSSCLRLDAWALAVSFLGREMLVSVLGGSMRETRYHSVDLEILTPTEVELVNLMSSYRHVTFDSSVL